MLVKVSVENFKSFDKREELSMISSSKIQQMPEHKYKIKKTSILKNAVIYGANASGKSNLVHVFKFFKSVLLEGLPAGSENEFCKSKEENRSRDSVFEIQFTVEDKFYAYGFSALLSERKITEEWLYELTQEGNARNIFLRQEAKAPTLGNTVHLSDAEKNRFNVYSSDFEGNTSRLFLTEMRGKRYNSESQLLFFLKTYKWLVQNIIVIDPNMAISSENSYTAESLENISKLIKTFDTGITEIGIKNVSAEEMNSELPIGIFNEIVSAVKKEMQMTQRQDAQVTCKTDKSFFNVRVRENAEPEITTLVLKHGKSFFDFDYAEESDGTKRLMDLIDIIVSDRKDTVYVVDELERSLHPKLTEHFLKLFMEAHTGEEIQLIFTTHEDVIMDQSLFRRDEIWFVERTSDNASNLYSLDRFKERYDKKLSKAYLEGRYGAIPVFQQFSFESEE